MGRVQTALVVAAFAASGLATAATSSSTVATSTANYRQVRVTGATATDVSYTVVTGVITGLTLKVKGHPAVTAVATARYGTGLTTPCVIGLYDAVNDRTPVTCTGFAEPAARPRTLLVAIA